MTTNLFALQNPLWKLGESSMSLENFRSFLYDFLDHEYFDDMTFRFFLFLENLWELEKSR